MNLAPALRLSIDFQAGTPMSGRPGPRSPAMVDFVMFGMVAELSRHASPLAGLADRAIGHDRTL
ncbi:MAG TPA: hypothetical protein VK862_17290 [Afifellaceae bacterium]|nr:hypothetical protein [Afifellaceae bacterium]